MHSAWLLLRARCQGVHDGKLSALAGDGSVYNPACGDKTPILWTPARALLLMPAGGDSFLQICLWRQGFAVTDPGPGLTLPDVQMFDPGTEDRKGLMHKWISAVQGECDEVCQVGLCNQHKAVQAT